MKPGERIRLVKEAAESLYQRPWHEVQLTLNTFKLNTYELDFAGAPDDLTYCTQQISEADDATLVEIHTYLLGEDAAPGPQQTSDRPWGSNPVAVFISHRHEDAPWVGTVRDVLASQYGIDAFVAHTDIHPSLKWRDTIRAALASCHLMVAVLHENFHESQWCDQEVGWALGRGIPVMPVRRQAHVGQRFDGFLEEHQDLVLDPKYGSGEWWLAQRIFERVLAEPKTQAVGVKALAEAFVNSHSYDRTRYLWAHIAQVETWDSEQVRRLEYAVETNRQVYAGDFGGVPVPDLVKQLVEKFEPSTAPLTGALVPTDPDDEPPF
jgi:hypothetical protein